DPMPEKHSGTVVGMVANLWLIKDPAALIEAARLLVARGLRLRFRVAGRGDLLPELLTQVSKAGLEDRFAFLGGVVDIPGFLRNIRVAVLTSRSEGLPNAVLEYMAAGRAIVATAVGGTTDLIESGLHGLIVRPGDPHALAGAIARLAGDPALAA